MEEDLGRVCPTINGAFAPTMNETNRRTRKKLLQALIAPIPADRRSRFKERVDNITPDILRPNRVDLFWRFVCERQNIWKRREKEGESPPWTSDSTLLRARFTNVYRELDPGTQYLVKHILEAEAPDKDKIFNVMIYRLIGRTTTYNALGFQLLELFDYQELIRKLKRIRDDDNKPVFSAAYLVSGYAGMGSRDKIENIGLLLHKLQSNFDALYSRILASRTPEEVYRAIRKMYGFGIFLAFQILVDLTYSTSEHGNSSILPFSNDEWAIAGPGAKRGISMLLKDGIKADELKVMFWLRTNQRQEFRRLGLDFSYLVDRDGHEKEISLSNIENCLCEFYKYLKLREANGKVKRRFIPIYSDALGRWMSDSFSRGAPNDYNSK